MLNPRKPIELERYSIFILFFQIVCCKKYYYLRQIQQWHFISLNSIYRPHIWHIRTSCVEISLAEISGGVAVPPPPLKEVTDNLNVTKISVKKLPATSGDYWTARMVASKLWRKCLFISYKFWTHFIIWFKRYYIPFSNS